MTYSEKQLRLFESIAELSESGMPLPSGLRAAANETNSRRMANQFRSLADHLEAGNDWQEITTADRLGLPSHLLTLVGAGIQSGNLGDALNSVIDHHRQSRDVWRQLFWSLAYPVFALAMALLMVLFAILFVVPPMEEIFADFGTELPAFTQFWIDVSHLLPTVLTIAALSSVALLLLVRMIGGRGGWHQFLSSLPVFGPLLHWFSVAEMICLLQVAVEQKMAIPAALQMTSSGVGSAHVAQLSAWLADGTEQGMPLAELMDATPRVPAFIVPVIRWGEQNGALGEALGNAHDLLLGRIRMRHSMLGWLLVPLIFFIVALCIGGLVIGMFMPLLSITQNLT